MMEGQKLLKSYTHEEEAKFDFDKVNEELFESAYQANKYANILMPLIGNLGYVSYVLVAVVGGVLAINGYMDLTVGTLAAFLQLNRSFNQPIGQISQQINMVLMALAGAERIFALMDEEVEDDLGHVSLVNAKVLKGDSSININKNDKIPMVPEMKITLGAKYSLTDRLSLLANYTYISEKEVRELDDEDNIKKFTIDSYGTI